MADDVPTDPDVSKSDFEATPFEVSSARGKAFAVGLSAIFSILYCTITMPIFVGESQRPTSWPFVSACGIGLAIFGASVASWDSLPAWLYPTEKRPGPETVKNLLYAATYALTAIYIVLLTWVCYDTGGPIKSPYTVILLAVAVLSPFATDSNAAMITVLISVSSAYVVSLIAFEHKGPEFIRLPNGQLMMLPDLRPPDALVAATALFSIAISVLLELLRRRANFHAKKATA